MYGGNCPRWIFLPVRCHFFKTLMAVLSKNLIITVGGWVHCHWCQKRPLDGAALTLILHCSCKQFMKKGRGRVTKSFRTWDKHKGKVTEGFHTISRTKKRLSKEENVVENLELPIFTGGFQVENLRWRVQNLLFPSAADMVDQGNQLKRVWECRKWSKSAIKV